MFKQQETALILVDVQGKLAEIVHKSEEMLESLASLIKGLKALDIPIIWLEQNPKGLGPTNKKIADLLTDNEPIPKITFSACQTDTIMKALTDLGRKQILLAGIETHICIYQTAAELKQLDYEVQVVADAVTSRTLTNHDIALDRIKDMGVQLTTVEMILFELMRTAEHQRFKEVLKAIK